MIYKKTHHVTEEKGLVRIHAKHVIEQGKRRITGLEVILSHANVEP